MPKSSLYTVFANMDKWGRGSKLKMYMEAETVIKPMLTKYAKNNRPWTDRTGRARRGLHSKVVMTASELSIQLHHKMYYGYYLEMRQAGKYAILRPTIDKHGELMLEMLRKAWLR